MMKMKFWNTSAGRITKVYALMLVGITVGLSLFIITSVGAYMVHIETKQADKLAESLNRVYISDSYDWSWWKLGSPMDTKTTFIKIKVSYQNQDKKNKYLYSPHSKNFIKKNQVSDRVVKLGGQFYYSSNNGLYYLAHKTDVPDKNSHYPRADYYVWIKLNTVFYLLSSVVRIIFVIVLISFVIGTGLIYLLAKRLNRPLVNLTDYTQSVNADISSKYKTQLPVPRVPQEVHDLSIEFNKLLDSLNQQSAKDRQFVSNVSHELKTPIAGIRGNVELIQGRGEEHPEIVSPSLNFIAGESKRIQQMIESMLKLSHANQLEVKTERTNLSQLVKKIVTRYQSEIDRQITLDVQREVYLNLNGTSIEQILVSLLDNARKYSAPNTDIVVRLTAIGKDVSLLVMDNGVGVPDEQKKTVFDRFNRGGQTGSKIPGNGLGLAIVKQLVELNHGTISIKDNQPRGSIFQVNFHR